MSVAADLDFDDIEAPHQPSAEVKLGGNHKSRTRH